MIEALHRLNPAKPASKLALLDDYPRWLKKEHEISGTINDAVPITATFELSPKEIADIETRFGKDVLEKHTIEASRKYEGEMVVKVFPNFKNFIDRFSAQHISSPLKEKITANSTTDLLKQLASISSEVAPGGSEATPEAQAAKIAKGELEKVLGAPSLTAAIEAIVRPLIPKTFYFSTYSQLRSRYNISEIFPALTTPSKEEDRLPIVGRLDKRFWIRNWPSHHPGAGHWRPAEKGCFGSRPQTVSEYEEVLKLRTSKPPKNCTTA
jgi:hypothetical protein